MAVMRQAKVNPQFCQLVVRQTSHTWRERVDGRELGAGGPVTEIPGNWVLKGSRREEQLLKKKACGPAAEGTKQACRLSHWIALPGRSTSWQEVAEAGVLGEGSR